MKRKVPELKLDSSPLIFVLGQVRIAPVLEMEKFVPPIQEALRRAGYPLYQASEAQEIVLGLGVAPKIGLSKRWVFLNKTAKTAVALSTGYIVLETCEYDTFEDFTKKLAGALDVIGKIASLEISQRLGLRYVNLIRPQSHNKTFARYMHKELLGLSSETLRVNNAQHRYELRAETDQGTLVVRFMQSRNGQMLPPDLHQPDLRLNANVGKTEETGILDIDHFSPQEKGYHVKDIVGEMWKLHGEVELAFRSSVTPEALKDWKARPLGRGTA